MELEKAYHAVKAILDTLDFEGLFAGFHKYKFALYNSKQICVDGKLIPYQDGFMGNTSIVYENEFVAIWNMEFDPVDDMEILAYSLVHEMFHCCQRENKESRYPSDLTLLNYPGDIDHFQKKFNENRYLAEAFEKQDFEKFQNFHAIRNLRLQTYPSMVSQELRMESLEGMAEYVGLTALQIINADKFQTITKSYLDKLRAEDRSLFDIRRISFYSGAIYLLCLRTFGITPQNAFAVEQTVYEQNAICLDGAVTAEITPFAFISHQYTELQKQREETVADHIAKAAFIACDAFICGYDPMNMFRVHNLIYCSHFICLNIGGEVKVLQTAVALKLRDDSNGEIVGYYI